MHCVNYSTNLLSKPVGEVTLPWRKSSLPASVEELTADSLSDLVMLTALLPQAAMAGYLWQMGERILGRVHVPSLPQLLLREQTHLQPLTLFLTDQESLVSQVNLSRLKDVLCEMLQVSPTRHRRYLCFFAMHTCICGLTKGVWLGIRRHD